MEGLLPAIEALGGGLAAGVIVGLTVFCSRLLLYARELMNARIEDQKQHTAELIETNKAVTSALATLDRLTREGRGNG